MTERHSSVHHQLPTQVAIERFPGRNQDFSVYRRAVTGFLLIMVFSMVPPSLAVAVGNVSPSLITDVVSQRGDQLATIDSDERALQLFITEVGPALGLTDAAGALGAKRLPNKMVKELGLAELSQSVHELMAALATWQLADSIRHDAGPSCRDLTPCSTTRMAARPQQDDLASRPIPAYPRGPVPSEHSIAPQSATHRPAVGSRAYDI